MKLIKLVALLSLFAASSPSAQDFDPDIEAFTSHVEDNPRTSGGYWLEMKNVLGEWEKVILVFGYADPGDESACATLRELALADSPDRRFRCNPVN